MPIDIIEEAVLGPALSATSDAPAAKKPPPALSATARGQTEPEPTPAPEPAKKDAKPAAEKTVEQDDKTTSIDEPDEEPADDAATDDAADPELEVKAPRGVRKRLDELTSARIRAEQRAEAAEIRATEALRALQQSLTLTKAKQEEATASEIPPRPIRTEFTDPDAYDQALVTWTAKETKRQLDESSAAVAASAAKQAADEARAKAAKAAEETWIAKTKQAESKYPDFAEVALSDNHKVTIVMAAALKDADEGADVAYWLGKNPKESDRISALPDLKQISEIARIAERLKNKLSVSKAPPPIKPVGNRSSASAKGPDEMSMDEYAAHRRGQLKNRS